MYRCTDGDLMARKVLVNQPTLQHLLLYSRRMEHAQQHNLYLNFGAKENEICVLLYLYESVCIYCCIFCTEN